MSRKTVGLQWHTAVSNKMPLGSKENVLYREKAISYSWPWTNKLCSTQLTVSSRSSPSCFWPWSLEHFMMDVRDFRNEISAVAAETISKRWVRNSALRVCIRNHCKLLFSDMRIHWNCNVTTLYFVDCCCYLQLYSDLDCLERYLHCK